MRPLLATLILLPLLAPLAGAASLSGEIVSDSPVDLFGKLTFQNDGLRVFHQAARDASLKGTVYNGTLYENRYVMAGCAGSQPRQERSALSDVRGGDLANIFRLELGQHALVIFEPQNTKDLVLSDGASTQAAEPSATAPLLLSPNPYRHAQVENSSQPGMRGDQWTEAFSQEAFLLVPTARFDSTLPGVLSLESGDLRVSRGEQTKIYTPRTENRAVDCSGAIPPSIGPQYERVTYSYQVLIQTGTLSFEQAGLANMRQYFAGERGPGNLEAKQGRQAPPPGYWYQNEAEALTKAYDDLSLPHTFFSAPKTAIAADGAARFRQAFGTISDNDTITEVDRKDAILSGNLLLTGVASAEEGRRMTSRVEGSLFVLDVDESGTPRDWTPVLAGAAAGALGLGLIAYVWPGAKWKLTQLLLFPLYARLKKEDILENPLRDDILHVVQATPGISASELGRRLECGWGTLVYHITVLERMGLVSSAREGRHKRFFAQGRINYSDKGAVALLANPAARTILDAVRQHPGIIQKDLGERLGLAAGTISWHIERLALEGLVLKEEDGRVVRYFPSERLIELTNRLAA